MIFFTGPVSNVDISNFCNLDKWQLQVFMALYGIKDSNGTKYEYQKKGDITKRSSLALQKMNPTLHYLG